VPFVYTDAKSPLVTAPLRVRSTHSILPHFHRLIAFRPSSSTQKHGTSSPPATRPSSERCYPTTARLHSHLHPRHLSPAPRTKIRRQ
jgi:hypothetical protein